MKYLLLTIILIIIYIICVHHNSSHIETLASKNQHISNIENLQSTNDKIFEHLKYFSTLFESNKIKFWLAEATLLGAIREKDIIQSDNDFDINVNIDDTDKILELNDIIKYDGYHIAKLYAETSKENLIWKNKLIWIVTLKIYFLNEPIGDIHMYQKFPDGFMRRFDMITNTYFWPPLTYPSWFTDELLYVPVRNIILPVPRDPIILLEYWFGKNWRTPNINQIYLGKVIYGKDYYGSYFDVNLTDLIMYLSKKYKITLKPNLTHDIKYVYPIDHVSWMRINDKPLHA